MSQICVTIVTIIPAHKAKSDHLNFSEREGDVIAIEEYGDGRTHRGMALGSSTKQQWQTQPKPYQRLCENERERAEEASSVFCK